MLLQYGTLLLLILADAVMFWWILYYGLGETPDILLFLSGAITSTIAMAGKDLFNPKD